MVFDIKIDGLRAFLRLLLHIFLHYVNWLIWCDPFSSDKERGYSQEALAKKMGIVRVLVSDYEKGRLRPHPEMVARFALVFGVTTDEIIGLKPSDGQGHEPNLAIQKRMRLIEQLPTAKRRVILQTIDAFIKGVE